MSFFQDIPPPLDDDKIKTIDEFDLEEEVIDEVRSDEAPEIPNSDFDVYTSLSRPPELSSALFFDATPPPDDDYDPSKSQEDSFEDDPEFHYHSNNFISSNEDYEKKVIETNQNTVIVVGESNSSIESEDVIKMTSNKEEKVLENSQPEHKLNSLNIEPPLDINQNLTQISCEKIENADSSFTTSLACNDDKIEENLHNEFSVEPDKLKEEEEDTNYAQAINFNENLSSEREEEKINQTSHDGSVDFSEIVTTNCVPELKFDDDDDDFNDFETAIPAHRHIDNQAVLKVEQASEEVHFEADFSGFEAFNDAAIAEEDDDFGDFNDFTQAPIAVTSIAATTTTTLPSNTIIQESHPIEFVKPSNVNGLLTTMFPSEEQLCDDESQQEEEDHSKQHLHNVMKSDDIVKRLDDFDGTLALGYLYASSASSQILVRSLGIDVRNILLGAQWNSSSMPRFAANLSFNPLEPLKPSTATAAATTALTPSSSSINKIEFSENKIAASQPLKSISKAAPDVIPEVEFDWNSSGLVNPLDGKQPNTQQSDDAKTTAVFKSSPLPPPNSLTPSLQPSSAATAAATTLPHSFENESLSYEVDEEEMTQPEVESSTGLGGIDLDANLPKFTSWQNEPPSFTSASSSSILVRERTIKLPETHIFTPVKSTSPVSREVIGRDESPSKIVVKEYHDIEYSLEPKKVVEAENDFDDFQSAPNLEPNPLPVMLPSLAILEPQKMEVSKTSSEISWPNPGNVNIDDDFGFISMPTASGEVKAPSFDLSIDIPTKVQMSEKKKEFSKPVIGNSPSKHPPVDEDDDFADFQAAPVTQFTAINNSKPNATASFNDFNNFSNSTPVMQFSEPNLQQPEKKQNSNESLTLSPAKLANTMKNHDFSQKPSWISSIDDDEVKRIEAAFPKCKVSPRPQQKNISTDEDDWTDFVGATSSASSNQNQHHSVQNNQADDWSDFVSVPAPTVNSISSQILNKPNFASWNQPSRPYVHHATSFLSSEPKNYNSSNTTSRSGMNITNNFNYHHQQNGISTIIPDLQFSMPKNLINLPSTRNGGGSESAGKK